MPRLLRCVWLACFHRCTSQRAKPMGLRSMRETGATRYMYWRYSGYVLRYKASTRITETEKHKEIRGDFSADNLESQSSVCLTNWISQGKVITLSSKDGIQTSFAVSAVWTGHHQCQYTYQHKYCHLKTRWDNGKSYTFHLLVQPNRKVYTHCNGVTTKPQTFATRTLQRNAHMTSPKSKSTMFLKSSAGRANFDTKFPKPFA